MADTGFIRFTNVSNPDGNWSGINALKDGGVGNTVSSIKNAQVILSGLSLGIPSNSTITGVEYQYKGRRVGS